MQVEAGRIGGRQNGSGVSKAHVGSMRRHQEFIGFQRSWLAKTATNVSFGTVFPFWRLNDLLLSPVFSGKHRIGIYLVGDLA
jgi:hypothetical protein